MKLKLSSYIWQASRRISIRVVVMLLGVLLFAAVAGAQVNTADVVGTVTDASGAVVPGATITVQNNGTGASRTATSSSTGTFSFSLLPVGQYKVSVELSGFKTFVAPSVTLSNGERVRVDAKMEVGAVNETVEVTSQAPALQTDNAVVGQLITAVAVQDLPLNGRNYISLATLAPGATSGGPNAMNSGTRPDDRRMSSSISVNGMQETLNNYMIDGMDNNERSIGTQGVRPSVDAMAEFRVQTNLYSAEVSRTAGGVLNVITKSGTNAFHGTAYEYYRNEKFDANPSYNFTNSATSTPKGQYRQHQYGGSIGGPIRHNKTFFFGDYEGLRINQAVAFTDRIVPTAKQRIGDFSEVGNVTIKDPVTGVAFANNIIPTSRISPAVNKLVALYPLPTGPGVRTTNYQTSVPRTQRGHTFDARIDHQLSDKSNIFGRYSFNNVKTLTPSAFPLTNGVYPVGCNCATNGFSIGPAGNFSGLAVQRAQNAQTNYVHAFSPTALLELRGAYWRFHNLSGVDNTSLGDVASKIGIPNVTLPNDATMTAGLPQFVTAPYASLGDFQYLPLIIDNNVFQTNGNLNITKGAHSLKFGFGVIKRYLGVQQTSQPRGWFLFSDAAASGYSYGTGDPWASFLLDAPREYSRQNQLAWFSTRQFEDSGFVQDDWRATKRLTLNIGLRYDIYTPYADGHNYMSNWDIQANRLIVAGQNGVNSAVNTKTDYGNLAPRVGFALMMGNGLVIRGGWGVTYFQGTAGAGGQNKKNAPFFNNDNGACGSSSNYLAKCPNVATGPNKPPASLDFSLTANDKITSVSGEDQNYKSNRVQQWNLTLQKDFRGNVFGIGYVGNVGQRLLHSLNINAVQNPTFGGTAAARPLAAILPRNPSISLGFSEGSSNYSAMQLTFDRRLSRGLAVNAQYTWSHNLSNVGGSTSLSTGLGTGGWPAQWRSYDYGTAGLDTRQRGSVMVNYTLPFGSHLSGVAGGFLKNWQVNSVYQRQTGFPLTVVNTANRLGNFNAADRPNQIKPITYPRALQQWFDVTAFAPNPIGFPGNESIGPITGPSQRSWDLSLNKLIQIREGKNIQVRMEGFNITNTPNFGVPNVSLPATFDPNNTSTWGSFGKISSLSGPPRQIQFAVKYIF